MRFLMFAVINDSGDEFVEHIDANSITEAKSHMVIRMEKYHNINPMELVVDGVSEHDPRFEIAKRLDDIRLWQCNCNHQLCIYCTEIHKNENMLE